MRETDVRHYAKKAALYTMASELFKILERDKIHSPPPWAQAARQMDKGTERERNLGKYFF